MGENKTTGFAFGGVTLLDDPGSSDAAPKPGGFTFGVAAVPAASSSDAAAKSKASRPRRAELVAFQKERAKSEAWDFLNESPWRQVNWCDETRTALLESIRSYKPACGSVPAARVLLVGPAGAGKSSFISSVQSVLYGRVLNRAMVGSPSGSSTSFTKKAKKLNMGENKTTGFAFGGVTLLDDPGSSDAAPKPGGFTFGVAAVPAASSSDAAAKSKASRPRRAELVAFQKERAKSEAWDFLNESPWRQVNWCDETRTALLESIRSYKPACGSVPAARVLLVGPAGAGKSSFISSVQSVLYGRVLNRAMVGSPSGSSTSFTKKLQSYKLHSSGERGGESLAVVLSDMAGLGEGGSLTLHDALAVIKGHVPDGHTFSALSPVGSDTAGYVKEPSLADRVHCVAYVVNASEISTYSKTMTSTLQQLREHVSALGVHQVALVTHVDKVYVNTTDLSQLYRSIPLKTAMQRASAVLGMPVSSMVPVKNYSEELDPELHTDTLLLQALELILQYVDLHLREHSEPAKQAERSIASLKLEGYGF